MKYTPNDDRSNTLNPNNDAFSAALKNQYRQANTNVWHRIIDVCDKTTDRICHRITNTMELEAFLGAPVVLRQAIECTHDDPKCLCVVDFEKTVVQKADYYLDKGDKHDSHYYMVIKGRG